MPIWLALIGFGKIAKDEHLPAIAADPDIHLVAVAGPGAETAPVRGFESHTAMLAGLGGQLDAVAICTPPAARFDIARDCLAAGLHVLLEKPPTVTLGEIDELEKRARAGGLSLLTAWHARYNRAVTAAAALLSDQPVQKLKIEWHEDVRQWHPGQSWIWEPGGFGVFDAGINAISIATRIIQAPLLVEQAQFIIPANMQTPIAAALVFAGKWTAGSSGASLDWRPHNAPAATLEIGTERGTQIALRNGGSELYVDQKLRAASDNTEYRQIYRRFVDLVRGGLCDVDREPLRVVADAFLVAHRSPGAPFIV